MGGAVTGFTKTYKRERPEALVKAVDFADRPRRAKIAEPSDRGNFARHRRGRDRLQEWTCAGRSVSKSSRPPTGSRALTLDQNTVFVVTGAAGSIVSAITADLAAPPAARSICSIWCLSPMRTIPTSKRFVADKDGLKRDLVRAYPGPRRARHAGAGGERTGGAGARAGRADRHRRGAGGRRHRTLLQRQPDRSPSRGQGHRAGARAQRTHRRSAARRGLRAQPLPARQRPSASSIWSST